MTGKTTKPREYKIATGFFLLFLIIAWIIPQVTTWSQGATNAAVIGAVVFAVVGCLAIAVRGSRKAEGRARRPEETVGSAPSRY